MKQRKTDLKKLGKMLAEKKTPILVCVCAVAVLLLVFGGKKSAEPKTEESGTFSVEKYVSETERELAELLSKIDGVGKCDVMITVVSSERNVYLADIESNGDNSSTSHIKIKAGGTESAVIEFRYMPNIAGVAVVCEGAGSVAVKSSVAETVAKVLGIDRSLVSVAKRK